MAVASPVYAYACAYWRFIIFVSSEIMLLLGFYQFVFVSFNEWID